MAKSNTRLKVSEREQAPVLAVTASPEPKPTQEVLAQGQIRTDGGTQMRAGLREETIANYHELMELANGWGPFPPVDVVYDGTDYWLTDGFHRLAAASRLFAPDYEIPANIIPGDIERAILEAAKANDKHGLPRSNADKRRAVSNIIGNSLHRDKGDAIIAEICAVSPRFVGIVRREMQDQGVVPVTSERVGKDGRVTNTAKIGRVATPAPPPPAPAPAPQVLPTHTQAPLAEDVEAEPIFSFEATAAAPLADNSGSPTRSNGAHAGGEPGQLLAYVLTRAVGVKISEAIGAGVLKDWLTPYEADQSLQSIQRTLREGEKV